MAKNSKKRLYEIEKLKKVEVSDIFGIDKKTVYNWIKSGCPKNDDETYSLRNIIRWRDERLEEAKKDDTTKDLDKKILIQRIRKLELEIAEKEKKTIPREKFEEIQRNQATELMDFVKGGFKRNSLTIISKLGLRAGKLLKFNEVMDEFMKAMFDAFIEGGKDID